MYEGSYIRIWFPIDTNASPAVIAAEAQQAAEAQNYAEQHELPFDRAYLGEAVEFMLSAPLARARKVVSDLAAAGIRHGNIDVFGPAPDDQDVAVLRAIVPEVFVSVITGEGNDHRHHSQ